MEKNASTRAGGPLVKRERLFVALALFAYVAIQSFAVRSPVFPVDDGREFVWVQKLLHGGLWPYFCIDTFQFFRPAKNLLFALFDALIPIDMALCRIAAILIGAASFFPVLAACRRINDSRGAALTAASSWLLAPTLVSGTAWLSCVNIQLMVAFVALSIVFHDRDNTPASCLFLLLGMLCYESAVSAGPALVAFDFFLRPERFRSGSAWRRYGSYGAITLAFLAVRSASIATGTMQGAFFVGTSRPEKSFAAAYFTLVHLGTWLWPFGRMAVLGAYFHGDVSLSLLAASWVVVAFLAFGALVLHRRRPVLAFGIAFFLLAFLPTSNLLGLGNGPYGDYYLALPSVGLSVAVADAALWANDRLQARAVLPLVVVSVLFAWRLAAVVESMRWASLWANPEQAVESTLQRFPKAFGILFLKANLLVENGRYEEAARLCDEIEELLPSDSPQAIPLFELRATLALEHRKDPAEALRNVERLRSVSNTQESMFQARLLGARVYEELLGDASRAEREYESALSFQGGIYSTIVALDRLARLKALKGERDTAIGLWKRALRLDPANSSLFWNISVALREEGREAEADEMKAKALRLAGR